METHIKLSQLDKIGLVNLLATPTIRNHLHGQTQLSVFHYSRYDGNSEVISCFRGNAALQIIATYHATGTIVQHYYLPGFDELSFLSVMSELHKANELPHNLTEKILASRPKLF